MNGILRHISLCLHNIHIWFENLQRLTRELLRLVESFIGPQVFDAFLSTVRWMSCSCVLCILLLVAFVIWSHMQWNVHNTPFILKKEKNCQHHCLPSKRTHACNRIAKEFWQKSSFGWGIDSLCDNNTAKVITLNNRLLTATTIHIKYL